MPTEDEIQMLYRTKVKQPHGYFLKYRTLPSCPVKRWNYQWGEYDFPRNWCILDFIEWTTKYALTHVKTLGYTCATDPECEFISGDETVCVEYPPHDLHTFSTTFQNRFDFFLFNQTIEHLYNPFKAIREIYDTIKKGGYVFTSVPTLNIPHMTPFHFNGFTPMGLAMLFQTNGFEVVEMGQWGNYEYIARLWANHYWPGYNTLSHDGVVENEEQNVCQCWILARKN